MDIFRRLIRDFRQWMKDLNPSQQEKPLIVSEYGLLQYGGGLEDPDVVKDFMLDTFDYFMNTKDCDLGYTDDDCRLVQRWAWYSLDDFSPGFNQCSRLLDTQAGQLSYLGQAFADYASNHLDRP
jgi:hypothetical protein